MGFQIFQQILGKYVPEDGVTEIAIPTGVREIASSAFSGCQYLKHIQIPHTVTTIRSFAFSHCYALETLELPDTVKTIESNAFYWCRGLTSIRFPAGIRSIPPHAFECCNALPRLELPETVTEIGSGAFASCRGLKEVVIPPSVRKIGYQAFCNCPNVREFRIPDGVYEIAERAFDSPVPQRFRLVHEVFSPVIFVPAIHNWRAEELTRVMQFFSAQLEVERELLFSVIKTVVYKVPFALFLFLVYGNEEGLAYIKKKPMDTLRYLIDEGDPALLENFLQLLQPSRKRVESLLDYAIAGRHLQSQLLLTRWKYAHFGGEIPPFQL